MLVIFLDLETTGLDPKKHSVIDVALTCVDISSSVICAKYQSIIAIQRESWEKADPQSLTINGYSWEDLQQGRDSTIIAEEIIALFKAKDIQRGKAAFICQNPSFDRAFLAQIIDPYHQEELQWPYHWLDLASMFWALEVRRCQSMHRPFPEELSLSKNAIAERYGLMPEPAIHRAVNGVDHLMQTYQKIFGVSFIESD